MHLKKIGFKGWDNCLQLANEALEIVITTDVGPRVISCALRGSQNMFKNYPEEMGLGAQDKGYHNFGGHRLWHAPEIPSRTYNPDNEPVEYTWNDSTLTLIQKTELKTGIQKEIEIQIDEVKPAIRLKHRLINHNPWTVELAPWCVTMMAPGGRAIIPQEPYIPHPEVVLPARPLVLWHYTKMNDPRWSWGEKYIQLRQDPEASTKQKLGARNSAGWLAYSLNGELFLKEYEFDSKAHYPDFGCNSEVYTDPEMLELETLGGLERIAPGGSVEHREKWSLFKQELATDEEAIEAQLKPLLS